MKMTELVLEDKLGPTNIGKDVGISNLVEGAVYTSLITAGGAVAGVDYFKMIEPVASGLGAFGGAALYNPLIPFFSLTAGIGHGLGEPGTKEKILTGTALGLTMLYSLKETLSANYGMSVSYYLTNFAAGNLSLAGFALMQAAIPVLSVFGIGYALGKGIRWLSRRHKKVTKRKSKSKGKKK